MIGLILAAGHGSRLGRFTDVIPKALSYLPGGRQMIDDHIQRLLALGLRKTIVTTGYLGKDVEEYVKRCFPSCQLLRQQNEIGTELDGLLAAEEKLDEDFILVHCDHYFSKDPFPILMRAHQPGCVTMMVESNSESESLGYCDPCLFNMVTTRVQYPMELGVEVQNQTDVKAIAVDGCMALPSMIFDTIRAARKAYQNCSNMADVFKYISETSIVTMNGALLSGWWANVNDEKTYLELVKRLRDTCVSKKQEDAPPVLAT